MAQSLDLGRHAFCSFRVVVDAAGFTPAFVLAFAN
jgi:hypothetical protein